MTVRDLPLNISPRHSIERDLRIISRHDALQRILLKCPDKRAIVGVYERHDWPQRQRHRHHSRAKANLRHVTRAGSAYDGLCEVKIGFDLFCQGIFVSSLCGKIQAAAIFDIDLREGKILPRGTRVSIAGVVTIEFLLGTVAVGDGPSDLGFGTVGGGLIDGWVNLKQNVSFF